MAESIDNELLNFAKGAFIPESGKAADGSRISDGFRADKIAASMLVESRKEKESTFIHRKVRTMIRTTEQVTKELEDTISRFDGVVERITDRQKQVEDSVKKVGSKVRDSANKLGEGLSKVEKISNFEKLERYAETLSNLADSLERIAELESTGKLEKLISAMK